MEANSTTYCLIYASTATHEMSDRELNEILAVARDRNTELDITGLLLYADGNFIQILEGDRDRVDALYEHIATDPRHYGAVRLMRRNTGQRHFSDWRMGFKTISANEFEERVPGFSSILHSADERDALKDQVSRDIWALLMSFRAVTRV
ncbi:MAG: BLUF domain-containing protein [Rhodothermales bacterium]